MAFIDCKFFSETLGLSTSVYVILPENTKKQIGQKNAIQGEKHPTLYLLHGLSDDHTIWLRRTSIERYVAPLGLAVVMPAVDRSFYTDMVHGNKYWTFISQELPRKVRAFFPLSGKREENFVAGLSMGGYGAFKLILNFPDKFTAAASLSGALNMGRHINENPEFKEIFGSKEDFLGSENDLFYLVEKVAAYTGPKPKLYQCCGTEDFLYEDNLLFKEKAEELNFDLTYEEEPATHEWGYWDKKIQQVLKWLPLNN